MKYFGEALDAHRGERVDVYLARELGRSRAHVQRLMEKGNISLLPVPTKLESSYRLRRGDELTVLEEPVEVTEINNPQGEKIPLDIVHEDKWLLVLNKPPGLVVHPAVGHGKGTLVNALIHHCGTKLAAAGGDGRPGLVHRLDKDTSGLMVVAKNDAIHAQLSGQFAERGILKVYQALCLGAFRHSSGSCKESIGRHAVNRQKMAVVYRGGKEAHTDYEVMEKSTVASLVRCMLHTGRTHQIRVHMTHLGHPILGDTVYGRALDKRWALAVPRQMLHAAELGFTHPGKDKWVEFQAPLPRDFTTCLDHIRGLGV